MNCCDYTCHQGRDCPGRMNPTTGTHTVAATHTSGHSATYTLPPAHRAPGTTSTPADDEIENDLGTAALQLLVSYACIAVVSFALGLFVGQL